MMAGPLRRIVDRQRTSRGSPPFLRWRHSDSAVTMSERGRVTSLAARVPTCRIVQVGAGPSARWYSSAGDTAAMLDALDRTAASVLDI